MKTRYTESPSVAARFLRAGGLVAFPTETVYGLGADAFDPVAVRRIFEAKGRPSDNPLIVHISKHTDVQRLALEIPENARPLMKAFWPGPLTIIVPKHPNLPGAVTAGLDTVGIRFPSHRRALAFLRAAGTPVAAPSANRSGRPSPTTWHAVREDLDGRIDCVLKGGRARVGLESTVVDCTTRVPVVLRAGAISVEALQAVVPEVRVATARDRARGRSPGLKHKHYAPAVPVKLVRRRIGRLGAREAWIGLGEPPCGGLLVCRCQTVDEYAHRVFAFFRRCEAEGAEAIYCEEVPPTGIGRALMDRLLRAAVATRE